MHTLLLILHLFMHIAPLVEEVPHPELEPVIQELDEEPVVLQQPQEEQQHFEEQPGYDYFPEAVVELTADPNNQGRHPKHLKPMQTGSNNSI
jgi:hypothetical protein